MQLKYIVYCVTLFHITSGVQALQTTRTATNLIIRWSSSSKVFFSDPASVALLIGEKSQSTCLDDSNKPLIILNNPAM